MAKFYKEEEKMVKELSKTDPEKFGDLLPRHRSLEKNLRILGYCLFWRHKNVQLPVLANKARSILEEQAALKSKKLLCNMKMKEVTECDEKRRKPFLKHRKLHLERQLWKIYITAFTTVINDG